MQMTQAELLGLPRWLTPPRAVRDLWKQPGGKALLLNPITGLPIVATTAAAAELKRKKVDPVTIARAAMPVMPLSTTIPLVVAETAVKAAQAAKDKKAQQKAAADAATKAAAKAAAEQAAREAAQRGRAADKTNWLPWLAAGAGALTLFALAGE